MAEVTKCHSGFEKGSLVHQTRIPNHNIKLKKKNARKQKFIWYKLVWNAYRNK